MVEELKKVTLAVSGMTCGGCVETVKRALEKVPGVVSAEVDLTTKRAVVTLASDAVTTASLVLAVKAAGYNAIAV
jgi:Cu+-exporting ATPase